MARKTKTYGLYSRNFPKSVRDRVDIDYGHKLTPELRAWLAGKLDEIHGADFRASGATKSKTFRRARYREKNAANRDIWGHGLRDNNDPRYADGDTGPRVSQKQLWPHNSSSRYEAVSVFEAATGQTAAEEHSPGYLNSPEYKAALENFRNTNPKNVRAMRAALRKLEATKK